MGSSIDHEVNLNYAVAFGRSSRSEVQLSDEMISGSHCRFILKRNRLELTDLDSKNGTYLNGIRVEHSEVFIGDEVRIGNTVITLDDKHMSPDSVDILTFPGPQKDRISYELKADFTGTRIENQSLSAKNSARSSHVREIELRKRVKSRIKLSKQEIKSRYKFLSLIGTLLDVAFAILILFLSFIIIKKTLPRTMDKDFRLYLILMSEVFIIGTYYVMNFKVSKFSIGEKISGIKNLYLKQ